MTDEHVEQVESPEDPPMAPVRRPRPVLEALSVGGMCSAIIAAIMLTGLHLFVESIDPFVEGNENYFWGILGWSLMIGCFCGVDRYQQASTRASHHKTMSRWNIDM